MMRLSEIIYDISPAFIQNLLCSIKGWQVCRRRYNTGFYKELNRYQENYYDQSAELLAMLYAIRDMEIYSSYLSDVDWDALRNYPSDVYAIIKKFPIINKSFVKDHIVDFINPHFSDAKIEMRTSGTTGGALIFPYSIGMENRQWAVWWRYRIRLGIPIGTWCGWLGGKVIISRKTERPPYWRINLPGRQVMFSAWHLTDMTVGMYHSEISRRNISWLHGYPSHISRLAALMADAGLEPLEQVRYVTTGAENVLGNQMKLMRKAFPNALIRQHYGLNEGVANISQQRNGEWKVDDDFCYVEFIPSSENPDVFHIVGTGFSNPAFPLVRYDTGDLATMAGGKIVSIDGRTGNVIRQRGGHDISEASLSIVLHDFLNIVEAQFHQKDISAVELWIVKGKLYGDDDECRLKKALKDTFDRDTVISLKYVDAVQKTASGKLKLVISGNS